MKKGEINITKTKNGSSNSPIPYCVLERGNVKLFDGRFGASTTT